MAERDWPAKLLGGGGGVSVGGLVGWMRGRKGERGRGGGLMEGERGGVRFGLLWGVEEGKNSVGVFDHNEVFEMADKTKESDATQGFFWGLTEYNRIGKTGV